MNQQFYASQTTWKVFRHTVFAAIDEMKSKEQKKPATKSTMHKCSK